MEACETLQIKHKLKKVAPISKGYNKKSKHKLKTQIIKMLQDINNTTPLSSWTSILHLATVHYPLDIVYDVA